MGIYDKKKLTYINSKGESIEIKYSHPYYLREFDGGMGTPKINIYTSKGSGQDGASYIDSTLDMRDILVSFYITRDYINNRNELYKIFIPKAEGKLIFEQGEIKRQISCRVENFNIKDKDDSKLTIVNLLCPRPFWEAMEEIRNDIATWVPELQFPLTLSEGGIETGKRQLSLVTNVINEGNISLGMVIKFKALGIVENPSLYDVYKQQELKVNATMQPGDTITIDTRYGKKRIELENGGTITNIINLLDYNSVFLQLEPGDNLLRYGADVNINNLDISLYYTPAYLGV